MHIPDGYLSPSTCGTLYAACAPFWYVAARKVESRLKTRFLPLVSVCAAFSFVIMMFNLPMPGGSTGHAAGIGLASVVLGPWAGMLALSTALLIQAVFFGDGGVLTLGANCFNIAVVGCLAGALVNRVVAGRSEPGSRRRALAAGLAGYVGLNAAALLTAVEFGLQPMLFRDASGIPLYAPFPLHVTIPAMMLGHLTFAGMAEFVVSAGVVSWLQRRHSALLAPAAPAPRFATRRLWGAVALLAVLTPLGLLSVGSAWGEWSSEDFRSEQARSAISAASGGAKVPAAAPQGLERMSRLWSAPMADYAPTVIRSASAAYVASAIIGVGILALVWLLLNHLLGGVRPLV